LQDPTKFTQIWIFGLKTNHLATLIPAGKERIESLDNNDGHHLSQLAVPKAEPH
jgi:hypothetical protein